MTSKTTKKLTDDQIIARAQKAEAKLAKIARTRRPTEVESQEARTAYAAAAAVQTRLAPVAETIVTEIKQNIAALYTSNDHDAFHAAQRASWDKAQVSRVLDEAVCALLRQRAA